MQQTKYDKEFFMANLPLGVLKIKFTKKDGTNREMKCTLNSAMMELPKIEENQVKVSTKKENPNVVVVWDVDVNDWRSFRINSVYDVEIA